MTNSVSKKRLALFASGRGSNGEALYKAMQEGLINGEFVVIITDHADAGIVERSKGWGIPLIAIERSQFDSKQAFEQAQLDALEPYCVDGIVLAGYMRIVGVGLIARYEHKILNIHPSLLPKYPGLHTYQRALENGDSEHGTTVHFVNEEIDGGAIVLQAKVPIFPGDTVEEIELRTREQEYHIYPLVIKWFVEDRLKLIENQAYLDGKPLPPNGYANE